MVSIRNDLRTGRVSLSPDLDDKELHTIGLVTAQWALLEDVILSHCQVICERAKAPPPADCTQLSFRRRRKAWQLLVKQHIAEPEQTRLLKIAEDIATLEKDRHKITHGVWDWSYEDPDSVTVSSTREPHVFEKKFDAKSLHELADRIGTASAAIVYPKGEESFFSAMVDDDGNCAIAPSRSFVRSLSADHSLDPQDDTKPKPQLPRFENTANSERND